ncbi:2-cyclohexenylcarbonyl CoA isomerase, partial [Streptomyces sp. NPDC002586]
MADTVLYEVSDGLATITLNRPEAMNALNIATKVALREAAESAAGDTAVRAILLTAAGDRAFCVGQDLKEHIGLLAADRETGSGQTMSTVKEHYNPIVKALAGAPKPVLAAVNGVAAGAGFG